MLKHFDGINRDFHVGESSSISLRLGDKRENSRDKINLRYNSFPLPGGVEESDREDIHGTSLEHHRGSHHGDVESDRKGYAAPITLHS